MIRIVVNYIVLRLRPAWIHPLPNFGNIGFFEVGGGALEIAGNMCIDCDVQILPGLKYRGGGFLYRALECHVRQLLQQGGLIKFRVWAETAAGSGRSDPLGGADRGAAAGADEGG